MNKPHIRLRAGATVPASDGLVQPSARAPEYQARYDAASNGRRMRGFNPPSVGPNRALSGLATIRNRTRDSMRNDWAGPSGERVWTTSLIGTGIICRPVTRDPAKRAAMMQDWDEWCFEADADAVLDFYGLQTLCTRGFVSGGEAFARLRARRVEDGLTVPLQVQLLESEMLPLLDTASWPGMDVGNEIRSGIEINRIGRRVAYWFHRVHPGDKASSVTPGDLVRVPAEQVIHVFEPKRPGQLRGVTDFAPVLARLRGILNTDDAVLERQKLSNLFTMFLTRAPSPAGPEIDPLTGAPVQLDEDGTPMAGLEPGSSFELDDGQDVKFSEPPPPAAQYSDFMRYQQQGVAAGWGIPYELFSGDLRDVSDRALRVILNEFHRHCEQRQWQIIIPQFCRRVRNAWARAAVLAGLYRPEDERDLRSVTWAPHAWPYFHPLQDVQARRIEKQEGFKARADIVAERGDDIEDVDAARAEDLARERRLKLNEEDAA